MQSWDEIRAWRRERRASLIAERQALSQPVRQRLQPLITGLLADRFPELRSGIAGFYWPIRGEIGLHHLIRELIEAGAGAALPVVIEKGQPLEFRAWRPGAPLERGVWNIPVPAERQVVSPTALLVPLVGFDGQGYRLGYGGGYYDRTLAGIRPRPLAIGIGYEFQRLASIHPQPHDIALDAIVTEAGVRHFERPGGAGSDASRPAVASAEEDPNVETVGYSSPPCFMHEIEDR
jgi:5-formyltetrahydrofolate cyclo-ligase